MPTFARSWSFVQNIYIYTKVICTKIKGSSCYSFTDMQIFCIYFVWNGATPNIASSPIFCTKYLY